MKQWNSTFNAPTKPMSRGESTLKRSTMKRTAKRTRRPVADKSPKHLTKAQVGAAPVYRNAAFLAAVRTLDCVSCDAHGRTQAAHSNQSSRGKAKARKSSDATAMALCGPNFGIPGCHAEHDQGGIRNKAEWKHFEAQMSRETIVRLLAFGKLEGSDDVMQSIFNFQSDDVEEVADFLQGLIETEQLKVVKP